MTVQVNEFENLGYNDLKDREKGYNNFINFLSKYWNLHWLNNSKTSKKKKFVVNIPSTFSLKENSDETLKCLELIFSYRQFIKEKELFLNFSKCQKIDVSSSLVLLIILFNFRTGINGLKLGAKIKSLDLIVGGSTEIPFIKISSIREHLILSTLTDVCSTITDFIDKNLLLTPTGKSSINRVVGELLTNFKEHLGKFSQFFISTFLSENGIITISFVGLGDTIYKSLKDNSTTDIKKILEEFNKEFKEENKGVEFDEELYWTLLSLQIGISKELEGENEKCRGRGMTSMLNFFFNTEISPICIPEMTIISGHTKITFDKNDKNYYNYEKGVICFNEEFDLKKKQDIKKIKKLKQEFPGTLISMDFILKN